jgi:hypothetical protein
MTGMTAPGRRSGADNGPNKQGGAIKNRLLSFEKKSYDYLLITPQELLRRLEAIHGVSPRYQVYVWVTKRDRAWLARGLKKADEAQIANGIFRDELREVTRYLEEDWALIRDM